MLSTAAQRARFTDTALTTASPQALLVQAYDRLVLDLERAEQAQHEGALQTANRQLQHAQEIVTVLAGALDVDAWSGGPGLKSLYSWLLREMVQANIRRDAARTAACRRIVEPLRDAWREASSGPSAAGGVRVAAALGGTA